MVILLGYSFWKLLFIRISCGALRSASPSPCPRAATSAPTTSEPRRSAPATPPPRARHAAASRSPLKAADTLDVFLFASSRETPRDFPPAPVPPPPKQRRGELPVLRASVRFLAAAESSHPLARVDAARRAPEPLTPPCSARRRFTPSPLPPSPVRTSLRCPSYWYRCSGA